MGTAPFASELELLYLVLAYIYRTNTENSALCTRGHSRQTRLVATGDATIVHFPFRLIVDKNKMESPTIHRQATPC
jgi:hypothetical protein